MNLLCLADFNEGGITARRGELCWFLPNVASWLLDSFPACWATAPIIEVPIIEERIIDAPPADKMIRKSKRK